MHEFKCNNLLNVSDVQITNYASAIVNISTKRVCGVAVSHNCVSYKGLKFWGFWPITSEQFELQHPNFACW